MLEEISFLNQEKESDYNTIKLEGINILVGPNNSGKTYLLNKLFSYFNSFSEVKMPRQESRKLDRNAIDSPYLNWGAKTANSVDFFKVNVSKKNKHILKLIHLKVLEHLDTLRIDQKKEQEFIKLVKYNYNTFEKTENELLKAGVIKKELNYQELIRIYSLIINQKEKEKSEQIIDKFKKKFNVILENKKKYNSPDLEPFDSMILRFLDGIKESDSGNNCIQEMNHARKKEINNRIKKFILKKIRRKIAKRPFKYLNLLIIKEVINIEPYYKEIEPLLIKGKVIEFANLLKPSKFGDNESLVWHLFLNDELRSEFKDTVFQILSIRVAIDVTNMQQVVLRIVHDDDSEKSYEKSITSEARNYFMNTKPFYENASDGILSLVGLLLFLLYYKNSKRIILLDEPDAFLHPPLAKKLGKFLSDYSDKNKIQIFLSTHSPSIIEGCLLNRKSLNVIRLTYFNETPKYFHLNKDNLFEMVRDASLRSNNIISSIFYKSVILCEGDSDRKLYSEINEKLTDNNTSNKIENVFYLYSDGNGNFSKFIKPIIKMGLPIAIITDLDIICEGNRLKNIFESIGIGDLWNNYSGQKDFAFESFKKIVKDKDKVNLFIQDRGILNLKDKDKKEVANFVKHLADKGIFLVPVGTLESWFSKYNIPIDHTNEKSKKEWFTKIFDLFSKNSIPVETDDIWEFMIGVNHYLSIKVNTV